jgi:hypothetical protein
LVPYRQKELKLTHQTLAFSAALWEDLMPGCRVDRSACAFIGGVVELLQRRRWAERNAGRGFLPDLMDGAEIHGIKAIAGVDGI